MDKISKVISIYFTISVILCAFLAFLGYALNGVRSDLLEATSVFFVYMICISSPIPIVCIFIDMIKTFTVWKIISLIIILSLTFIFYTNVNLILHS